jgi:hypothetical protein
MTTLSRAIQHVINYRESDLEIACRVICKRLFRGEAADMLTMVLVDEAGNIVEAKTWNTGKAHAVYRKFNEDDFVILVCPLDSLAQPDENYSHAVYETYGGWSLFHCNDDQFDVEKFCYCYTNIHDFHLGSSQQPAKMLAGILIDKGNGPRKYNSDGQMVAKGHFIKLLDEEARVFRALVWECLTDNTSYNFPLEWSETGCCVLLPFAREQDEYYRAAHIYTVTTSYPPVVSSKCISSGVQRRLSNALNRDRHEYNPYMVPKVERVGLALTAITY